MKWVFWSCERISQCENLIWNKSNSSHGVIFLTPSLALLLHTFSTRQSHFMYSSTNRRTFHISKSFSRAQNFSSFFFAFQFFIELLILKRSGSLFNFINFMRLSNKEASEMAYVGGGGSEKQWKLFDFSFSRCLLVKSSSRDVDFGCCESGGKVETQ